MRRRLIHPLLILLIATGARDALGFECHRRLLTGDEQRTLEAFVLESSGIAADPSSIRACRNWDVVLVETVRAPQPDGTERLARLNCWPMRKSSSERWHCVGPTLTGFRADTYPGELGVWVAIETPTALGIARRHVALGFELLGRDGAVAPCGNDRGERRTLGSLRAQMTRGAGFVLLGRSQEQFWLEGDDVIVYFERDAPDFAHVKCWEQPEILVTG
jgi:hypothetical protein